MNEFKYVYWSCDCWIFEKFPLNLCAYYMHELTTAAAAAIRIRRISISLIFTHFFGVFHIPFAWLTVPDTSNKRTKNHKVESSKPKRRMREPYTPSMNSHVWHIFHYTLSPFVSVGDACVFVHLRCMLHAILWLFSSFQWSVGLSLHSLQWVFRIPTEKKVHRIGRFHCFITARCSLTCSKSQSEHFWPRGCSRLLFVVRCELSRN